MLPLRCVLLARRAVLVGALLYPLRVDAQSDAAAPTPNEFADLGEPAIPPGQEALLATMLGKGAALPEECKLTAGDVQHTIVKATYQCAGGEVVFELIHPSQASASAAHTERFALRVLSGSPPAALREALTALIRAGESTFVWQMPAPGAGRRQPPVGLAAAALAGAALAGVAVLAWLWRRRRARAAAPAARGA